MTRWLTVPLSLVATSALADIPKQAAPPNPELKAAEYSGLGAESLSPQEVAKYAPPPLDDRMSRKIQAMIDVRGSGGNLTSAKGDRQFYVSRITGVDQIWRQDGPLKFPQELTGGEDRTLAVGLAPDDSFLVASRDVGGGENPGLYLLSPEGGSLKLVQHTPKVQTILQYIGDDSKSLYFRANDKDPASYAIYRYDVASEKREVQIHKQLEQRKIPGGLIVFPDEGHGAQKRGNIVLTLGHTIAFFEKHLLGK